MNNFKDLYYRLYNEPELVEEFTIPELPGMPFDFAIPDRNILFEIDGGIFLSRGGHTNPHGSIRDRVKGNIATAHGWRVYRLSPQMINEQWLLYIMEGDSTNGKQLAEITIPKKKGKKQTYLGVSYYLSKLKSKYKASIVRPERKSYEAKTQKLAKDLLFDYIEKEHKMHWERFPKSKRPGVK